MIYSTPSEIQSYLSTIKPGDYHLAYYPPGNHLLRRCDGITLLSVYGTDCDSLAPSEDFGYNRNAITQAFDCSASLIIPDVTTIEQARQPHPEAFL